MVEFNLFQIITTFLGFVDVVVLVSILFFLQRISNIFSKDFKTKFPYKLSLLIILFFFLYRFSWLLINYYSLSDSFYESVVIANIFLFISGILFYKLSKNFLHNFRRKSNASG